MRHHESLSRVPGRRLVWIRRRDWTTAWCARWANRSGQIWQVKATVSSSTAVMVYEGDKAEMSTAGESGGAAEV